MPVNGLSDQNEVDADSGSDFVEGPSDHQHIPDEAADIERQRRRILKHEINRLTTFDDWPLTSPVKKEQLAKDGFYCLKNGDKVKCIFCNIILKSWEAGDCVRDEHKKFNPLCPFLLQKNTGNVPIEISLANPSARHAEFSDYHTRQSSFTGWPTQVKQKPADLARCGFFYTGHTDSVSCFYCGGNLRNWHETDDPVMEHRHWFPNCEFVKNLQPRPAFELTPVIQRCIDMGYDSNLIQVVVTDKRERGEGDFDDLNSLIDAVEHLRIAQDFGLRYQEQRSPAGSQNSAGEVGGRQESAVQVPVANISGAPTSSQMSSAELQLRELLDRLTCKICMDRTIDITFQPCGHFVACEHCAQQLQSCPVCKQRVRAMQKTYIS